MSVAPDRGRNAGEVGNGGGRSSVHRRAGPAGRGSTHPDRARALRRRRHAAGHAACGVQAQHRAARTAAVGRRVRGAASCPGVVAVYTGEDLARLTTAAAPGAPIGMHMMPGLHAPVVSTLWPPTRCATSAIRSRSWSPKTATSPRTRSSSSTRTSSWLDPVVTYEDALDPSKPLLFDELDDNVALGAR